VSVIIGEGGSGGAVAFATANRIAMLEHSVYSVISPEGCASILWKNAEKMREAAEALRLTAQDLHQLGIIDRVIDEPMGGAQRDRTGTIDRVGAALRAMLDELQGDAEALRAARRQKFLDMGAHAVDLGLRLTQVVVVGVFVQPRRWNLAYRPAHHRRFEPREAAGPGADDRKLPNRPQGPRRVDVPGSYSGPYLLTEGRRERFD